MIKNGYTINFPVKYSEMDCGLALKPSVLLNFLQDTANENAEKLGFGYSNIKEKNLMWYLLKYRMEFSAYPVEADMLTIKTEPRGYAKLFTYAILNFTATQTASDGFQVSGRWRI